jgi:hypothetical protein
MSAHDAERVERGAERVGDAVVHRVVEERRAAPRYDVAAFGEPIACRVNPGHEVELVNVSAVGACVQAGFALLPGRPLQLHAHGNGRRAAIEARVTWCKVTALMSGRSVRFTAGLSFMRWVDLARELGPPSGPRDLAKGTDGEGAPGS